MAARIQDLFTIYDEELGLSFTDAIYYEINNVPADLEEQKQARFDAWKETVLNPPPFDPTQQEPDMYESAVISILDLLDTTGTLLAEADSLQEAKDAGAAQVEAVAVIAQDLGVEV